MYRYENKCNGGKFGYIFIHKCLAFSSLDQEQEKPCKSSEYMNLHFKIKWLYSKFIADVPQYKGTVPEYPR